MDIPFEVLLFIFLNLFVYLQITHMEMIKGIQGHGYYDELVVPIIENTAHERELTDSLAEAVCPLHSCHLIFCVMHISKYCSYTCTS